MEFDPEKQTYVCSVCGYEHDPTHELYYQRYTDSHMLLCRDCAFKGEEWEEHSDDDRDGFCDLCGQDLNCPHHLGSRLYVENDIGGHDESCGECGAMINHGYHLHNCSDESGRDRCSLCGATGVETELRHERWVYRYDREQHWMICTGCGMEDEDHYDHWLTDEGYCFECDFMSCAYDGWHVAACDDPDCCRYCLEEMEGLTVQHEYSNWLWASDADGHWHACTRCGAAVGQSAHDYRRLSSGIYACGTCGYLFPLTTEGTDGTVLWSFDPNNGVLRISGEGNIPDYMAGETPWVALSDLITVITLGEDITGIGNNVFSGLTGLRRVEFLQDAPPAIAENAFAGTTCVCAYSSENEAWNGITTMQYGGTLTWVLESNDIFFTFDDDNRMLIISGHGRMPDYVNRMEVPWIDYAFDTVKIEIGGEITYIGTNAFRAFTYAERIDFMGSSAPMIGTDAFAEGSRYRYYDRTNEWPDGFIYLPVRYSTIDDWNRIVLETDGTLSVMKTNSEVTVPIDSVEQGIELSEEAITFWLLRMPTEPEMDAFNAAPGRFGSVWIRDGAEGNLKLRITNQFRENFHINTRSASASLRIDLDIDTYLDDLTVFDSQIVVNGNIRNLSLSGKDNVGTDSSVTVNGNIESLDWIGPDCTTSSSYEGSLTVNNGTVANGYNLGG